ncbi:MAG: biotin/lipoyl-binding protein, partial [Propionibacterium sp.]|nr:biotin/lipoyl-binding protein [Propionibacterium sp.]
LTQWRPPRGPGVRVDEGYLAGMTVPGAFDSLVAKIIVTGADRTQALQRARRALAETVLEGMPSVLPFHRVVLDEPAFTAADGEFGVHTRWIETEFTTPIAPYTDSAADPEAAQRQSYVVEVDGRRLEVRLPADLVAPARRTSSQPSRPARRGGAARPAQAASADLTAPMQGTIVRVAVAEGDQVGEGDLIVVLEAMKMEQPIAAHRSGTVRNLRAEPGASVASGAVLCTIAD